MERPAAPPSKVPSYESEGVPGRVPSYESEGVQHAMSEARVGLLPPPADDILMPTLVHFPSAFMGLTTTRGGQEAEVEDINMDIVHTLLPKRNQRGRKRYWAWEKPNVQSKWLKLDKTPGEDMAM